MEHRMLGKSGLKVTEMGLGGNNFGYMIDEETSVRNQSLSAFYLTKPDALDDAANEFVCRADGAKPG